MLEVYIDGACEPVNPGGTASYGVVVLRHSYPGLEAIVDAAVVPETLKPDIRKKVWEEGKVVGSGPKMSNNVAEYAGLIAFLKWLIGNLSIVEESILVYSDSQLLVNQMEGKWKVRRGLYVPYYWEVVGHLKLVGSSLPIKLKWIPREANTLADSLSIKALAEVGIYRR